MEADRLITTCIQTLKTGKDQRCPPVLFPGCVTEVPSALAAHGGMYGHHYARAAARQPGLPRPEQERGRGGFWRAGLETQCSSLGANRRSHFYRPSSRVCEGRCTFLVVVLKEEVGTNSSSVAAVKVRPKTGAEYEARGRNPVTIMDPSVPRPSS